jgi:hypothetical protein
MADLSIAYEDIVSELDGALDLLSDAQGMSEKYDFDVEWLGDQMNRIAYVLSCAKKHELNAMSADELKDVVDNLHKTPYPSKAIASYVTEACMAIDSAVELIELILSKKQRMNPRKKKPRKRQESVYAPPSAPDEMITAFYDCLSAEAQVLFDELIQNGVFDGWEAYVTDTTTLPDDWGTTVKIPLRISHWFIYNQMDKYPDFRDKIAAFLFLQEPNGDTTLHLEDPWGKGFVDDEEAGPDTLKVQGMLGSWPTKNYPFIWPVVWTKGIKWTREGDKYVPTELIGYNGPTPKVWSITKFWGHERIAKYRADHSKNGTLERHAPRRRVPKRHRRRNPSEYGTGIDDYEDNPDQTITLLQCKKCGRWQVEMPGMRCICGGTIKDFGNPKEFAKISEVTAFLGSKEAQRKK